LLKIVEVDRSTVAALGKPTYLTVLMNEWTGEKHVKVFGALQGLVKVWKPARIVIDATGVGGGNVELAGQCIWARHGEAR